MMNLEALTLDVDPDPFYMLSVQETVGMEEEDSNSFQRHSDEVLIPFHYDLTFHLKSATLKYECSQNIYFKVNGPTNEILLHGVNFQIEGSEYQDEAGQPNPCSGIIVDTKNETMKFVFENELVPGKGVLQILFIGEISDTSMSGQKGLYCSKYTGKDGREKFNYHTFFEPTGARFCFLCFDEPNYKSTFSLSLLLPKNLTGLSNMPIFEVKPYEGEDGQHEFNVVQFITTPMMSTYLFAFAAGEFDFIEVNHDINCRVYTPPGKKHQGSFALDVALKCLTFYKQYLQMEYPLPKLDLVSVADFQRGAMGNWGLITFRESSLLVDDLKTSTFNKQSVALLIARGLAQQWFGNLVTVNWWSDLWLTEGFAESVAFDCISEVFPEYSIWLQFTSMIRNPAMKVDSLSTSHPLEMHTGSPSEIYEVFDAITYKKGTFTIHLLRHALGDEAFYKGMILFLIRFQYSNVRSSDLGQTLREVASSPELLVELMRGWMKQNGYPIFVGTLEETQDDFLRLRFELDEFTLASVPCPCGKFCKNSPPFRWPALLCLEALGTKDSPVQTIYDDQNSVVGVVLVNRKGSGDQWIMLNPDSEGYFRVEYPSEIIKSFGQAIQSKLMPVLDRQGILEDTFAFVKSGRKPTVELLELLIAFVDEDDYVVWTTIADILIEIGKLVSASWISEDFRKFALRLLKPTGNKVGWEQGSDETHFQILLRPLILKLLIHFEDAGTLDEARKRYHFHVSQLYEIPADFRQLTFTAALMEADEEMFESSIEQYHSADVAEEKDRILIALTSMKSLDLIHKLWEFCLTDAVHPQDSANVLLSLANNKLGRDGQGLAWELFKENWKLFLTRFPDGQVISDLVKAVTENFMSEDKAMEIESFFREHSFCGVTRSVQQSIETIRINLAWFQKDEADIVEYLQNASANDYGTAAFWFIRVVTK